ncbi:alpha/beta fold hydrolase [Sphingobacterium suaedae]|uniref:Alpha/beta fold hydrolase n=1 Tax=Sphingobacterium suaedae TaxID=1686402 RepID=A0ABW5KD36_9SPHI
MDTIEKEDSSRKALSLQPAEKGYADVNGIEMYFEVHGDGDPIVLIHGSFMTIPLNWSALIPRLAQDRKVIVAEMQGHGRTEDSQRTFSYEHMADDISALLKHIKVDSADILGYSMGGGVAFQMAIRHPKQVRKLVVLSGTYAHDGWWPDVEASFKHINPKMFDGTPIRAQYDSLRKTPEHFPEFVKKVIQIDLEPYDWSKEAVEIKAPILYIIGDADGVRYEHALSLFKAKGGGKMGDLHGLPASQLAIIPGTTHIGMMHRADLLIPMISEFLESTGKKDIPTF